MGMGWMGATPTRRLHARPRADRTDHPRRLIISTRAAYTLLISFLILAVLSPPINHTTCWKRHASLCATTIVCLLLPNDGCAVDAAMVKGILRGRGGIFRLDCASVRKRVAVTTSTFVSPGTIVKDFKDSRTYTSSCDQPSHKSSAVFNRAPFKHLSI
ncbi:hypothetical protein FIBSPDRAFT_183891 [Athelia psychrophila]|uniref:Uncharacterized protein n=1 Tax=Athelia psychrophila TaxID=1759441 RepID=A0A166AER9_9AGAM|nr:hypothetical protein FIBSPDRAFT_183891 [Fibularhizoctonia sp. CBS 109695]